MKDRKSNNGVSLGVELEEVDFDNENVCVY